MKLALFVQQENFNPRLREGGDSVQFVHQTLLMAFQSTPPRRRRPLAMSISLTVTDYFNPRLREGGDKGYENLCHIMTISIHASAKEATHILLKQIV